MPRITRRVELKVLGTILAVDLVLALIASWKIPFQGPTIEYLTMAYEFGNTHRIASPFLSIGYSALVGAGYSVTHTTAGMTCVNILISLLMIAAAWLFLRLLGVSIRGTAAITLLLSVYPDFMLSYNKVQDTNITGLLLFSFLASVLLVAQKEQLGKYDVLLGCVLGADLLVRPNMALLVPLAWLVIWRSGVRMLAWRMLVHTAVLLTVYLTVTTAVHGKPFLPQNGPYNFFVGYNPYTIRNITHPEDSLLPALAARGIRTSVHWGNPADLPGVDDARNEEYRPLYLSAAKEFIRAHPLQSLEAVGLRFWVLLEPDFTIHKLPTLGGWAKLVSVFGLPLWLIASVLLRQPGPLSARLLIPGTMVAMVVPFMLTISAPRFAVPLEFVAWVDLGAMMWARLEVHGRSSTHAGYDLVQLEDAERITLDRPSQLLLGRKHSASL